ncbi:3-ketoacyl-CoA thiolase [Aerosticca soli]|uniref:3-ketoacyl-CoA thiolase n=2 Tax=Aerosticca soli TaxID=2010829 RepID=A0A2Z6E3B6_9GAMM|nr:thiolase family protein [Fulvimonas sp.]BBD79533.1 3-ketoacyl-CoA thiolase [Aerosticca soli]
MALTERVQGSGRAATAIVGIGFSTLSRRPIGSARMLARDAIIAAVADAGLEHTAIDGLLINRSPLADPESLPLRLQQDLQWPRLRLLSGIEGEGSSAVQMLQYASLAVAAGLARHVVCVFADDPIRPSGGGGQAFSPPVPVSGIDGWEERCGLYGATGAYALAAQEYLDHHGLDADAFAPVALAQRAWAQRNPRAFLREPLTREGYLASPWIVEPFRLLDCAYPINGAIAFVVTTAERAADLASTPVHLHGMGQGHGGFAGFGQPQQGLTGAALAGRTACAMAGVQPADIGACQFYDAFSFTVLLALEEYGLCAPGEAAAFVAAGHTAPGGRLPCNTGGGHLSGYYLQGVTPIAEAVRQLRGEAGEGQLEEPGLMLVTGNGGRLDYHAAVLLARGAVL